MERRNFLSLAFSSVLSAAVCAGAVSAQATDRTPLSFRLDWTIYGTHAPFYLALQDGLYAKEGLDVTIGEGQGSATVAKLVGRGHDQMGFVDLATMARAVEEGLPLTAVARVVSDAACIVSHADDPIKDPAGLKGKIVAFAPSESTAILFPALLASQKIDPKEVSVLSPAFGAKNAMFLQNRADAIPAYYNVQVAQLEAKGAKVSYFKFSDYGVSLLNNGIVANNAFLKSNPEAVRGFVKATAEAFKMAEKDPKAAIDALIKQVPEQARNRDDLTRQLELTFKTLTTRNTEGKPFGWMAAEDWKSTQDILVKYGGMLHAMQVQKYYTNDFLPQGSK